MPAAIRQGDSTTGHQPTNNPHGPRTVPDEGPIAGSEVWVNGKRLARKDDWLDPSHPPGIKGQAPNKIAAGSGDVFATGAAAARVGDATCGEADLQGNQGFASGSDNVFINGD